jgi:hypothetical protein
VRDPPDNWRPRLIAPEPRVDDCRSESTPGHRDQESLQVEALFERGYQAGLEDLLAGVRG